MHCTLDFKAQGRVFGKIFQLDKDTVSVAWRHSGWVPLEGSSAFPLTLVLSTAVASQAGK